MKLGLTNFEALKLFVLNFEFPLFIVLNIFLLQKPQALLAVVG